MKKRYKILILLLLIPFLGFSNGFDLGFSKQKNINKAYFVNPEAGINIDNSYGNITISTWDEDKVELDINIKVSGNSENWVNKRIDDIDVDIIALKNMISATTNISSSNFYNNGNNNSFEINYNIKIPKNGSIKINNKYGDIFSSDIFGNVVISCKYGKISLGKLNGNNNDIDISYCPNSSIDFIKTGNISAKYSGLKCNKAGKLNLISDYTDVEILESQAVNYSCKYGKLRFQKTSSIVGSGNYLTVNIGELLGNLKIETNYSNIAIGIINEKADNIIINSGYTDMKIGYDTNYAFDFEVSTKYADIKLDNDLEINNNEETNNSKQISGFYKKKGVNKLQLSTKYGNIKLSKKQ
jgi:hypothetical protein